MPLILDVVTFLIYVLALIILIGLLRPWYVLWFMDRKNRWLVLKIYGMSMGILILFKIVMAIYF